MKAISITDHDTVEACKEADSLSAKYGVEFISGVEFSCYEKGKEFHILGYLIDTNNERLISILNELRKARMVRAKKILSKLNKLNININLDDVLENAKDAPIARPHIALTLLKKGFTKNFKEAFLYYLGDGRPAYEAKFQFPVEEAIKLIKDLKGLSILSHPARYVEQNELYGMIEKGLDGIEIIHPLHDKQLELNYQSIARQYWLLETGGSDFHGTRDFDEDNFGKFVVPYATVESLRMHAGRL